jgi:hypothetical protein
MGCRRACGSMRPLALYLDANHRRVGYLTM